VRRLLVPVVLGLLWSCATLFAALTHSNLPVFRAAAADVGNWLLADAFYGTLRIGTPSRLSLEQLHVGSVRLADEEGRVIVELREVRVELDAWDNVGRWMSALDKLTIALPHARIERAHVDLVPHPETGEPTLVRALTPRPGRASTSQAKEPKREVRVFFPVLEFGRVTAGASEFTTLEPTLSSVRSQLLVTGKGVALDVHELGANVKGVGGHELAGTGSLKLRAPGKTQATFVGFLGEVELQAAATIEGTRIELDASSQAAKPDAMKRLLSAWPFRQPVSGNVRAEGQLPDISARAEFATETSSLSVAGQAHLAEPIRGQFDLTFRSIDARAFLPEFPETKLNATAKVAFETTGDASNPLRAGLEAETEATVIAGNEIPALSVDLDYERSLLRGDLHIREPNLPVQATLEARDERHVEARLTVPPFALEKSRRIPRGPTGIVSLTGVLSLDEDTLQADLSGRANGFRYRDFSAERIDFDIRGTSSLIDLGKPDLHTELSLRNLRYQVIRYDSAQLEARGTPQKQRVSAKLRDADGRKLDIAGFVDHTGRLTNVSLKAERHGVAIAATIDHADPTVPAIEVSHLELAHDSARLVGKVRYRPGLLEGELSAQSVDVARVAAAFGLANAKLRGTLDSDSTFALGSDLSRARLSIGLSNGAFDNWGRTNLNLDATLEGQQVTGSLAGRDETSGVLAAATLDMRLAGHALEPDSYTGATGSAELSVNNVRLAGLDVLLADERVSDLDGLLGMRARLERHTASGWPSALVELGAQGLGARLKLGQESRELRDVAIYTSAMFDAAEKRVFGSGVVADAHGSLVTLTGATVFDPDAVVKDPKAALRAFQSEPINVVVSVPRRSFDAFPLVQTSEVPAGSFDAQLTLYGSPNAPRISALVELHDVAPRENLSRPVSLQISAQYAPDQGDLDATLQGTHAGRNVLFGKIAGTIPVSALFGVARWSAEARLGLDHLPIDLIPAVAASEVSGDATGTIELSREGEAALVAQLDIDDIHVAHSPLGNGSLIVKGSPGEALLNFTLMDLKRTLNVKALALGQDPEQLPLPHQLQSLGVAVQSRRANAALLGPALRDVLGRLKGDLDVDATWFGERLADDTWSSRIEGRAEISRGNAYVDALGLELHDVRAEIRARPAAERTLVEIRTVTAKARTTAVNFEGSGQLYLEGSTLIGGDADVLLRSVPLTLEGLSLGKASGRARCVLERTSGWDVEGPHLGKDYLAINLDLEHWNLKAARSAGRQLIDVSSNPDVVVLQAEPVTVDRPDLTPYRVFIRLRPGARFGFGDISLPLEGEVQADWDGKSRVRGELRLAPGSRLPIMGKRFDVLAGTVRLDPENLGNPELDIALSGATPDGNLVHLTVAGTVQEPILDPPASELEALFGGSTATLLGGGVQALGFNELLGESVGNVELRVDAGDEEEDDPSYAAAVQIGPNLWFEGGYKRAQDGGVNQGETDVFSGTVDYRFRESWSLKSRLGNTGGGVDVLWQHRY
jgi:hypothetical protein